MSAHRFLWKHVAHSRIFNLPFYNDTCGILICDESERVIGSLCGMSNLRANAPNNMRNVKHIGKTVSIISK